MEFISKEPEKTEEIPVETEETMHQPTYLTVNLPSIQLTEESHIYHIIADYKKSTYQTKHWTKNICGKMVTLLVTTYFYWGRWEIELTDKEKEEILKKESIILNDYNVEEAVLNSSCGQYEEIENKESYTEEELMEINMLIYTPVDDEDYDSDEEYEYDEDILRMNGWEINDTIYGFDTGCELTLAID
jgi:hypothetical protein